LYGQPGSILWKDQDQKNLVENGGRRGKWIKESKYIRAALFIKADDKVSFINAQL
jgi:hypothetical protein